VLVDLYAAALNHRDVWIRQGAYSGDKASGPVLAANGAGVVKAVGSLKYQHLVGKPVLINCCMNWASSKRAPEDPSKYEILGLTPHPGTLAEQIVMPASKIHEIPKHMSMHEAAALPLAGLTAWRATFTKAEVQAGDRVLISGIGGGVAIFGRFDGFYSVLLCLRCLSPLQPSNLRSRPMRNAG